MNKTKYNPSYSVTSDMLDDQTLKIKSVFQFQVSVYVCCIYFRYKYISIFSPYENRKTPEKIFLTHFKTDDKDTANGPLGTYLCGKFIRWLSAVYLLVSDVKGRNMSVHTFCGQTHIPVDHMLD